MERIVVGLAMKKCWKKIKIFKNANPTFDTFIDHICINVIQKRGLAVFNKSSRNIYDDFTSNGNEIIHKIFYFRIFIW